MAKEHHFAAHLVWTGAAQGPTAATRPIRALYRRGRGQAAARRLLRSRLFAATPRGYNPEDLLVVSLSACHMLSYLYLCASAGIEVVAYEDRATGTMAIKDRRMRFVDVLLAPKVTIAKGDREKAIALHEQAHETCFIANSVNFPVRHEPVVEHRAPVPMARAD